MIRDFFVLVAIYHVESLGYLIIKARSGDGDVGEVVVISLSPWEGHPCRYVHEPRRPGTDATS